VQLQLLVEHLSQEAGQMLALRSIKFARLRQLVVPGDRLEIHTRPGEGACTRVDVKRDGVLVANAELELGSAPPQIASSYTVPVSGVQVDAPPLDLLLPHRPPMRFVEAIEREWSDGLQCAARISTECGLVQAACAPALIALEAAAQSAAAWEAVRRSREAGGAGARIGYLVAIRDTVFHAGSVPADELFTATVRLEAAALPLTHYTVEVVARDALVLRGKIATVLTDERR
jgi:predicted hotdog family 3-hydroxylacyl-ACP dehydratase